MTKAELLKAIARAGNEDPVYIELGTGQVAAIVDVVVVDGTITLWPPAPLCLDQDEIRRLNEAAVAAMATSGS